MSTQLNRVASLARAHTDGAIRTMAMIMNCEDTSHSVRLAAANSLMDRGWGKAAQPISGDPENPLSVVTRIELVGVAPVKPPPY